MNHSSDNKRLTKNTLMLYIRMFLVMGISLYTSRVILHALGVDNYGIFNVVGGVIALLGFINSSMSLSVQRFYSFSLGKKNIGDLEELFNLSTIIHIVIAISIAILFFCFGEFIISHYLNIPSGRETATLTFFKFIVISTCMGIVQVPFTALFIAFEKMETFAVISIVEVTLKLIVAFIVKWVSYDPLIVYGILISFSSIIILSLWITMAKINFKDIKYKFKWNHNLFKNLLSFATWSAMGEIAWAFTIQGVSVILNIFWGVVTNAAYGIANQISGASRQFVNSFQTAINPQLIKRYAAGELEEMFLLTLRGIKFSFFLILIFAFPAIVRMKSIISFWLGEIPGQAVIFSQLVIVSLLFDTFSMLFAAVPKAYGKIRNYQMAVSAILVLNFPFSYLILYLGYPSYFTYIVYCFVASILIFVRLIFVRRILKLRVFYPFFKDVFLPVIIVICCSALPVFVLARVLPENLVSIIIIMVANIIFLVPSVYFLGCQNSEKKFILQRVNSFLHRKN